MWIKFSFKSKVNEVRIAAVNNNKESGIPNGLLIEELRCSK